ncbi:microsomal glutathione S-transferase 1-like isoform X1 [Bradysia coprophila]|uniref:microsomal glutathione S-transferase 1-like isoform X1 n=1 Tax=Bradysia coprophila TaxID=38358 RepID=UPI00187DC05E|nr:microsomal glutathione S-transferase 1-like isoform X1 [Bradysia coprophila]
MQEILAELTRNEVFRVYVFWSGVLVLKMLFMSVFTGMTRFRTKTFANPEDLVSKKLKVKFGDEDVERIRSKLSLFFYRAHRNDLENILPFFTIGFFYIFTSPSVYFATQLYRAAAISRLLHTFVYAVVVVPQPARAIAFFVPLAVTGYMAVSTILYFL